MRLALAGVVIGVAVRSGLRRTMIRCTRAILRSRGVVLCFVMALAGGSAAAADLSSFVSARTEYDASARTATVYLTNVGKQAIIGGAVLVRFNCSDGSNIDQHTRFDLLPSVGIEGWFQAKPPGMQVGALQPGGTYQLLQGSGPTRQGVVVASASAQPEALVLIDNTAVGDSEDIDMLFENWRDEATTFGAWNKKAGELLVTGDGVAALGQLSAATKAVMARHPASEPRIRFRAPVDEEEALARHAVSLEDIDRLLDQIRVSVDAQKISEAEGLNRVRDYLHIRAETTAAHAYRKGGQ